MIVKVCGMREPANILAVEQQVAPDCMGFIFYPKSKRYVRSVPAYMPASCDRVGVFVNAEPNDILERVCDYGLHAIQLHGEESPEFIAELRRRLPDRMVVIKALSTEADTSASLDARLEPYFPWVDFFLFDTPTDAYGGSGQQFDWSDLETYHGPVPFLLSGGIGPDSIEALRAFRHPRWVGIDLNSRFESAPAVKDVPALQSFVQQFRTLFKGNSI